MSIDLSTIRPGGKVSVTLTDGTKIIDSPVADISAGHLRGDGYWIARGFIRLTTFAGGRGGLIASIDAYTPPTPEWDRPEVFAVKDRTGDTWVQDGQGKWVMDVYGAPRFAYELEDSWGPCAVLAVYAEGVAK